MSKKDQHMVKKQLACLFFLSLFSLLVAASPVINEGVGEERLSYLLKNKQYFIMDPPLVAMLKIEDLSKKPHYVQLFLALRHEGHYVEIAEHQAKIRDTMIEVIGEKDLAYMSSLRGRRLIVFELLRELQNVMWEEVGDPAITEIEIMEIIVE